MTIAKLNDLNKVIPFKWRIQSKKDKKAKLVAYIEAVQAEDLLDEVVGKTNWKTTYENIKNNMYCIISIRCYDTDSNRYYWVSKSNCGTESNMEAQKGEAYCDTA